MEVTRTIKAGEKGSLRFLKQWGDQLVAVRYRKDHRQQRMLTTIEVIVDERPLYNQPVNQAAFLAHREKQPVAVCIEFDELELRGKVKQQGARWSRAGRLWVMTYGKAVELGLGIRIVKDGIERCTDVDTSIILAGM